jgi:hypothetical protein
VADVTTDTSPEPAELPARGPSSVPRASLARVDTVHSACTLTGDSQDVKVRDKALDAARLLGHGRGHTLQNAGHTWESTRSAASSPGGACGVAGGWPCRV